SPAHRGRQWQRPGRCCDPPHAAVWHADKTRPSTPSPAPRRRKAIRCELAPAATTAAGRKTPPHRRPGRQPRTASGECDLARRKRGQASPFPTIVARDCDEFIPCTAAPTSSHTQLPEAGPLPSVSGAMKACRKVPKAAARARPGPTGKAMSLDRSLPILVVEDFSIMSRIICRLLKRAGFDNVEAVADGPTALTQMRAPN